MSGDARLLKIALENLPGNVWKFTSKRPLAKVELGSLRSQGEDLYFVRDKGAGTGGHLLFHVAEFNRSFVI